MLILETGTWTAINEDRFSQENIFSLSGEYKYSDPEYLYYVIIGVFGQYRADSDAVKNLSQVHHSMWERPAQNSYSWLSSSSWERKCLNSYLQDRWVLTPWGVIISCC